jgi:hypothetical protein
MRFILNGNIDQDTAMKNGFAYCTLHNFGIYEKRFNGKRCIKCPYLLQNNGHPDAENKQYKNSTVVANAARQNSVKIRRNGNGYKK